ncbi:MAG: hypothetical protein MUE85_16495 [Microscillaceae bacterium]|jgi:hypothetical protein|nr:hypothetical protein [Microscillaceae bacterium]
MNRFFNLIEFLKNFTILQIFTIYTRYLIGGAFVFASIIKIQNERFTSLPLENPVGFFFEAMYRTGMYWQFIGWVQLVGGLLLMTQYFATLGAIIYFVLILNIFLITYSVGFTGTPAVTFLMLLATVYLLVWDWQRLLPILTEQKINIKQLPDNQLIKHPIWAILGLIIFGTTVVMQVFYFGSFLGWFLWCFGEGLLGFILYFTFPLFKRFKVITS